MDDSGSAADAAGCSSAPDAAACNFAMRGDSVRRLEAVSRLLKGWVWETDAAHRFVYMSPSVEQFGGRKPEQHYGKTLADLGILTAVSSHGGDWVRRLEARLSFGPVDFLRYDEGRPFFMRAMGEPQLDAEGRFTGYVGLAFATPDGDATEVSERRASPRRRTVRAAEVVVAGQADVVMSAVLVDVSETGARLRVPEGVELPPTFELAVSALSMRRRCEVRWQANGQVGIAFVA